MADFGTRAFTGLNTQTSEHLIGDGELVRADNASFDELGSVNADASDLAVVSGDILGAGFANIDGSSYYFYKRKIAANTYIYKHTGGVSSGAMTGTWDNENRLYVHQGDDAAILTDGGEPYIHDGTFIRKLGPVTGTHPITGTLARAPVVTIGNSAEKAIKNGGVTVAVDGEVTVETSAAHGLSDGDYVYIDGVSGAYTEINESLYRILYEVGVDDADQFRLDGIDGSDWTTGSQTGGTVYVSGCGHSDVTEYRVSYTITLPDGSVIESSPETIYFNTGSDSETLSPEKKVNIVIRGFQPSDITGYIPDTDYVSAHLGIDLLCGAKIWRNDDASGIYHVVHTVEHDDIYDPVFSEGSSEGWYAWNDQALDRDYGATWDQESFDVYGAPPDCTYFATANGYSYCMDADNPTRLYISMFGDYEHWPTTRYVEFPGVTALVPAGDYLAIFSKTRLWYYAYDSSGGVVKEIPVQAGVGGPEAVVSTSGPIAFSNDLGLGVLFFANDLGLWKADPGGAIRISDHVKDDWVAAGGGTWTGAVLGDKMIWACDTGSADSAFTIKIDRDGAVWGRTAQDSDGDYEVLFSDPIDNKIMAQNAAGLYQVSGDTSTSKTMTVKSKLYGGRGFCTSTRMFLDLKAGSSGTVSLYSDLLSSASTYSVSNSGSSRTIVPVETDNLNGHFWQVEYSGSGGLYGWHLIVNENQRYY